MSTKKKIVVIHHQPLEIFPPVQNFLNYLAQRSDSQYEIVAISTSTSLPFKKFECSSAIIKRVYSVAKKGGPFRNVTNFGVFTLKSLFHLIQKKTLCGDLFRIPLRTPGLPVL